MGKKSFDHSINRTNYTSIRRQTSFNTTTKIRDGRPCVPTSRSLDNTLVRRQTSRHLLCASNACENITTPWTHTTTKGRDIEPQHATSKRDSLHRGLLNTVSLYYHLDASNSPTTRRGMRGHGESYHQEQQETNATKRPSPG